MSAHSAITSLLFVLMAALLSALIFVRLRQPSMIGYIVGGLLIGPHALGLVPYQNVELISELGIALLMFVVGVELSIPALLRVKNISLFGGLCILACTSLFFLALKPFLHFSFPEALIWGLTTGLSSTVVVLKILSERGEVGSTQANVSTGLLLFQDIISIPILIAVPFLANLQQTLSIGSNVSIELGYVCLRFAGFLVVMYIAGRFITPNFFRMVANSRSKELFSISVLTFTFAIALLSQAAGLSLALGAFVAGLALGESEFGNQAASEVLPLKDALGSVFFIGIGMLIDAKFFAHQLPLFLALLATILCLKFFCVYFTCLAFRYQSQISVYVALALGQVGEFSFLILLAARKNNILSENSYQLLLGISIVSILATPYSLRFYPKLKKLFSFANQWSWILRTSESAANLNQELAGESDLGSLQGHIIICGYGPTGSIVAKELQNLQLTTAIVDLNYRAIQNLKANKQNAVYGDSSSSMVLEAAGLEHAALLVVTIPDPLAMRSLVKKVKLAHPKLPIVLRVKYQSDRDALLNLGADEVVCEEQEAGKELARRSLRKLGIEKATEIA